MVDKPLTASEVRCPPASPAMAPQLCSVEGGPAREGASSRPTPSSTEWAAACPARIGDRSQPSLSSVPRPSPDAGPQARCANRTELGRPAIARPDRAPASLRRCQGSAGWVRRRAVRDILRQRARGASTRRRRSATAASSNISIEVRASPQGRASCRHTPRHPRSTAMPPRGRSPRPRPCCAFLGGNRLIARAQAVGRQPDHDPGLAMASRRPHCRSA
jgi:hypothetical protein